MSWNTQRRRVYHRRDKEGSPGRTKESMRDSVDINLMMSRFNQTGVFPELQGGLGSFGDFSDMPDFQTQQNRVIEAEENFLTLPLPIRTRFHNDAALLIEFLADPANVEESIEMGLRPKAGSNPVPTPPEAEKEPTGETGETPPD